MATDPPRVRWLLLIMGVVVIGIGAAVTGFIPDNEPFGRLQIPAGTYGPVIITAGVAMVVYGVIVILRGPRR
ncbi:MULTISPECIES: hypothetical protein [Microbacterium]|uniref:hypothetical protein n=1 Tax=Microbacterium TaxID=33882 RepID=UPI00277F4D93|nr:MULTISPECIES: hypothetical protein [Microbacterium]MDQ1082508.1 drug/metabolite transporter (DMT)-like permease [Microbacterium sp. SORGH_AS_0344]MDQ1168721.1 drug/metabolite transporter (DMT)-like permease [Microbacterium proteolyticum]